MKLKYFLRGLGIGILFTALVLCISYRSENSDSSVIERARKLGMEFPEKTPDTLLNPTESPDTAASGQAVRTPTATPGKTGAPTATPTSKATAEPTAKSTAKPTAKPTEETTEKTHTFTVRSGLLSSSVAREMKEAGIIKDADAFDEYLEKSGMGRKVLAGKYKIPAGASYEEIVRIITKTD